MARLFAHGRAYWNPLLTSKDEFARAASRPAPIKGSDTSISAPAISRVSTPASLIVPVVGFSLAPALAVTALFSNNELFKQFIKAYLEAQVPAQIAPEIDPEPCKQPVKDWFLDLYYGNLHMDCYWFC